MSKYLPLIFFTVLTNFGSQILLKHGMSQIEKFEISLSGIMSSATSIVFNWHVMTGLLVMVISMGSHLVVLSRVEISYAYPFLGLSFVLITLWGYFALHEAVTFWRVVGVLMISAGVAVVARN